MKTYLTNAIGMSSDLNIQLNELDEMEYEAVLLASDGFYELPTFEQYVKLLIIDADLTKTATTLQTTLPNEITDDASFAVLRFVAANNFDLKTI